MSNVTDRGVHNRADPGSLTHSVHGRFDVGPWTGEPSNVSTTPWSAVSFSVSLKLCHPGVPTSSETLPGTARKPLEAGRISHPAKPKPAVRTTRATTLATCNRLT